MVSVAERTDIARGATAEADAGVIIELLGARDEPFAARMWQDLERQIGDGGLACSWVWTSTWLKHFGDVVSVRFAVGRRAGVVVGMALLTVGRGRWGGPLALRKLHIGTAGEPHRDTIWVEYNRLLAAPADKPAFAAALVATVAAEASWDEFALDGFAPEDAEPFFASSPAFTVRYAASPAFDLQGARDAGHSVLDGLRSTTRQRIRRSMRGFGTLRTEWAVTAGDGLAIFDELIHLHQLRWTAVGQRGAFASSRFTAFHRDLIPRLMALGTVVLFRVSNDTGTIGCLYSFIERGDLYFYQGGLAAYADNKLKPGLVTHALCMQACMERGLREYNFLAGEDRYKQELATLERQIVWATARRRTARTLLARGGEWGIGRAKVVRSAYRAARLARDTARAAKR